MQAIDDSECRDLHKTEFKDSLDMDRDEKINSKNVSWTSAHVCPACGVAIDLAFLDMGAVITGILTCPNCDWSGRIYTEPTCPGHHPKQRPQKVYLETIHPRKQNVQNDEMKMLLLRKIKPFFASGCCRHR